MQQLVLGTVQLGLPYGVTNESGQPSSAEAESILSTFTAHVGSWFDTAPSYGTSEDLLGKFIGHQNESHICTKSISFDLTQRLTGQISDLEQSFQRSLMRLGRKRVEIFLMHQADCLNHPDFPRVKEWLLEQKQRGAIAALGVSIYDRRDVHQWESHLDWIDWVQMPLNILDQRVVNDGFIQYLRRHNIQLQARSVFLQGLLLSSKRRRSGYSVCALESLARVHRFYDENEINPLKACLDYVQQQDVDQVLVGANSNEELMAIINAWSKGSSALDYTSLVSSDNYLIHPPAWS